MARKAVSKIPVFLLVLSLLLVGCRRSAAPSIDPLPEDDADAMIQDAQQNTEAMQTPEATDVVQPTPVPTEVPAATEAPAATPEPTPTPVSEPTAAPTLESQPTAESPLAGMPTTHVVQPGENLFRIALRYGLTVEALAQANGITNPSVIFVGQKLSIPGAGTPSEPPPSGEKTHVVQPGENLFRIALKYNYDYFYLARYNGISNPASIYVGQVIRIP